MLILFITVFIYLLGFGIIIPILPILSRDFGADAFQTGLLLSCYSLMQFLFSPMWGKLSDRFGRRPLLLLCLFGEGISYVLLAYSHSLTALFAARLLAGFFGASLSTASAAVSDLTPPGERSKGMAIIGAAFGLGFVFGPAIGGLMLSFGCSVAQVMFAVAGLCFANGIAGIYILPETLKVKSAQKKASRFSSILGQFQKPTVGLLMTIFFFGSFAMSTMEANLIFWVKEKFNWSFTEVSYGFAYIGICIAMTQGLIVRKMLPKLGERVVLRIGLLCFFIGLSTIVLAPSVYFLALSMTFLALGTGLTNPSTMGSISLLTDPQEQGLAMGTTQSLASLGRILGPAFGGYLAIHIGLKSPFIMSSALLIISIFIYHLIQLKIPQSGKTTATPAQTNLELCKIDQFQLENLIRNRIRFACITMDAELPQILPDYYQKFWQSLVQNIAKGEFKTAPEKIAELAKQQPIVIVCPDGKLSKDLVKKALALNLNPQANIFYLEKGLKSLTKNDSFS